jgi:hypothetical protein
MTHTGKRNHAGKDHGQEKRSGQHFAGHTEAMAQPHGVHKAVLVFVHLLQQQH